MEKSPSGFISLKEATRYCRYSQEYLLLRARRGKLKAVKIGRNWVTKKEWVKEYLKKVEEYENNLAVKKAATPPENLPVEKSLKLRFGFVIVLVFVFLATGIVFGQQSFKNDEILDLHQTKISEAVDLVPINQSKKLTAASPQQIFKETIETFKEFGRWLAETIKSGMSKLAKGITQGYWQVNDFLKKKISQGFKTISQFFEKLEKIVGRKPIPKPAKEGLVVVPSTEKDEEVVKKIKESFSDEVKVELKDKTSGIIIPIFREREGEKYLYILVPIKN